MSTAYILPRDIRSETQISLHVNSSMLTDVSMQIVQSKIP